uniref:Aminopeptidase n=1 Tax=Labrus bergylta TaxID=56723 RepID=A0A3Q3EYU0_9LABR
MAKKSSVSKGIAAAFVILTVSAVVGIVTMVILYKTQIAKMNPTPRPTISITTPGPPPVMRLPTNLIPQNYKLVLQPHLYTRIIEEVNVTSPNQTMLFTGNSTVDFHCVQKTSTIYLHSLDLAVSGSVVMDKDKNELIRASALKYHEDGSNFLEIQLSDVLDAGGNYSLFLTFKGEISQGLEGEIQTYQHTSISDLTIKVSFHRFLAATNFQPSDARRVFPCFDEPEMKAVFDVTIIHRRDTIALGNSERSDEEWKYTRFHPTPRMSTYLFAFCNNIFCSQPYLCFVVIQTYARPEAIRLGHAQYAANITGKVLTFYENRFGINYQQRKLDQIAMPDLSPSAMENWGLITYEQGGLLFEEGVSSLLHKEMIITLIAHELAHQWFGNLVTMKWWNEVWLNEGFATYMTHFAIDSVEPTFKMEDALETSHPLSPPEEDVQDMYQSLMMFDAITYSKAVNEDGGHTKVAKVMDTWTKQIGYPVITINTTSGEIYQKHFLFNDSSESSLWWYVPIRVMSGTSEPTYWILANVNCVGYYRVNYNPENWQRLLTQLERNRFRIPLINRGQLVEDAFNSARAKIVDVTLALNATRFLRNETEFLPWESAVRNLEYFVLMFDRTEVYGPMQAYLREQVKGLYNYFRNETDNSQVPTDHSSQHNQITAIKVACSNGLPDCIDMATKMYSKWMNSNDSTNIIHPNLRSEIYCQAVAAGGRDEWEFAWDRFQSSSDTSEKEQLRRALACTKTIWLLNRYLEYTLNPEMIRLMDVASTINYISQNVAGQALAWNFIRAHWEYVRQGHAASLIEGVTRRFSTQFELDELERFAVEYQLQSGSRVAEQAIEQTRVNIEWISENKEAVLEWFERETAS